jgi:ribosome-associated protein
VIFVPSAQPPHKHAQENDPIAPAVDRMHWVSLAIEDEPDFEVDGLELEREGASYSVDTLRTLIELKEPARLFFILGHDAFIEMGTWRAPEEILEMVDVVVMSRPPVSPGHLSEWLPEFSRDLVEVAEDGRSARNRKSDSQILVLDIQALDVSASQVRSDLAEDKAVQDYVPQAALEAIVLSGHYGNHVAQDVSRRNEDSTDTRGNDLEATAQLELLNQTQHQKLATIVNAALERNAQEPAALDVRALTSYTDCVVVLTGNSNRQLRAISEGIVKALKAGGDYPLGVEGGSDSTWMLIDANDVIVHVFEPDSRELFDIEGLWTDAPRLELDLPDTVQPEGNAEAPPRIA